VNAEPAGAGSPYPLNGNEGIMLKFFKKILGGRSAEPPSGDESLRVAVAGQRRVEEERRQTEEHFEQLVAGVRDYAVLLLDRPGNVLTWNAGAERIKGYQAHEIIGQHFSRFYPPDVIEQGWPAEELRRAAAEGRLEDEGWRIRKDGSRFWASVVITALREKGGEVRGFLKITRDLTERKQAEEKARRLLQEEAARRTAEQYAQVIEGQREQLRVTLTSIGDAVITTDAEGRVTLLNPVAETLTGWTNGDAVGQPLQTVFYIVNEKTRQAVENPVAKVLATGRIVGLANHTVLIAKDGTERGIDDSGAPIRDGNGNVTGVVLVFRDVTEQRKAEQSARFLASIVESSDDAIIGKDVNGIITSWNGAAERLFGYTAVEAIGQPIAMLAPPDRADEMPAILARMKRGEQVEQFDTVRRARDGRLVPISLTVSPIRDEDGNIIGASKIARDVSERKRAEEALREEKARLHATLTGIGDAVIVTDAESRVTLMNPVAQALTGWNEEAEGRLLKEVFRIINEQTRQPVENPVSRVMREGVVVGLANHTLLIAKDGTERPIDDSAAPIRNAKGEVAGVVLVFRDVSERRRQERLAQDALAYAENIIATMREPFLVLDRNLQVQTANRSFYQTFHVSQAETANCSLYELGNGQWNIPRLRALLGEVLPQNHSFDNFEVEHDFPTIGRKIMLLNARRIRKPGNCSELILLAIEDITERQQAEVAVQTSEVRYRRLFETAKDGILILDADTGKILDANPFMVEMLGYSHVEFLGKELWEIGLFSDKSENEAAFRELQQHGYVRYDHLPLETHSGKQVDVEFISNVYQVDHRHVAQCNIRDISERSRLERQTKEQAEELSDLHRRKDEFLAMLSHELRNPLAPISNAVQMLRLQQRSENLLQQQARTIIERQVGLLKHLVDDLLEVSRITTGRVQLRQERVVVSGIVEVAVETVRPLLDQRRHELTVALPPEAVWVNADAARLEQVIANLLANAAKYTVEGGHIWLAVQREGNACVVRVRDTGVGIAPELLPRIFDLFTQAERSLDRSQGGLGIGLALVQRLTQLHGGTVEAYSALGQGSEFVVRLPVALTPAPQPPAHGKETAEPTTRPLRVLAVDDNVDTAESMAMLVKAAGHDVRTAHDGPTTLQTALDYRPNVVLLDIGLPGLNGFEVAKRLRQQPVLQSVVLVAMTGYGQEADRQRSQEAGFDYHLVKPADFGKVQQILVSVSEKAT
jgi:PAS domain S-box-containing protein